ncbi:hypothetical protein N7495_005496 [Penicillium taxi]|uniref:uncharacterized protein n=1 Tax=Penicillium taxi TaxID=168475 RepID=UPI002545312B|nr:uncharacterized protein N7495_005496 [Penicillium taxi]KAJ5893805.1 hypothetical protein N7495_005496 [Penicillium taxi]
MINGNGNGRPRPPPPRGANSRQGSGDTSISRAEKFEDEKKRIMQSCYSKKDSDGTLIESYITHVRITEDAAYPSTPAPPESAPNNKKPRVIIVSVRRSGRVRMHKARENNDGSFSIGKTWMLDDLTAIQTYHTFVPKTPEEQHYKEWSANVGFVVVIGKPYYWHARSAKEKDFFIGSLVKIYKKYTGGRLPTMFGFDERERQLLIGEVPGIASGIKQGHQQPPPSRAGPSSETVIAPQAPPLQRPGRDVKPEIRRQISEDPIIRAQKSREQLPRPSTASKPAPPFGAPSNPTPYVHPPQRMEPKLGSQGSSFLQESSQLSIPDSRPSSSRGEDVPKSPLTTTPQPIEKRTLEPKLSTDALRPVTPGSFNGETRGTPSPGGISPGGNLAPKSPYQTYQPYQPYRETPSVPILEQPRPPPEKKLPEALKVATPPIVTLTDQPKSVPVGEDIPSSPLIVEPEVAAAVMAVAEPSSHPEFIPTKSPTEAPAEAPPEAPKEIPAEETPISPASSEEAGDAHRPGLGPMVKNKGTKELAGAFRKAATAYGAFKPRAGGAGERLLAAAKKQKAEEAGPDGITGVVPAPFLARSANDAPKSPVDEQAPALSPSPTPAAPVVSKPTVEITQPPTEELRVDLLPTLEQSLDSLSEMTLENRSRTPSPSAQSRRRRRREDNTIKYCQALGIEISILDGRGIDFDDILTDLGWNGRLADEQKFEDLEADIRREIGRVEATSWLGNLEQQDGKVEQLGVLIDKTIEECDELDGLLTLYSHELNTLHEDVAYIEAQSQGLQVQTANQKLLQNELQSLLKTLSISSSDIRPLKEASLSSPGGLRDTENALSTLYKAMLMIDNDLGSNKTRLVDASVGVYANTDFGQMRAIKQKKEEYHSAALVFLQRLKQFMAVAFKMAEQKRVEAAASASGDPMKLDSSARHQFRAEIWKYNPLMLFAREVSMAEWHSLVGMYDQGSKPSYQAEFRDNNSAWKKIARKPTGEESELLFTHQEKEKEAETITMAARKLTVRRGKTVRAAAGLRLASNEKKITSKVDPYEAFAGTLRETLNMITQEQNFLVEFFHLNSLANADFSDLVSATPESRQCPDVSAKQSHDLDRTMAKRVEGIMDEVYSFWPADLQSLIDWALQADPLQGIGILFSLESAISDFEESNQEFVIHAMQKVHTRLMGLFNRFVDEQIRGIEDTKVKVNKRKGVISFMRVFPHFSNAIENMLSQPSSEFCDIRISINEAYDRINRAMWESLKFIAKEAPGQPAGVTAGAGDPEDKEVLNYHILLIENMNHYAEEVDEHHLPVLQRWKDRANEDFAEHMKLYLDSVIHRPLGKLLDFIQSIENLKESGAVADIASRASYSRSVAKKLFSSYDVKEIKRGVELLKKRVEKHFGDADDPGLSRSLVIKVLRECEIRYENAYDKTRHIIDTVYEGQLELDWRKEDVNAMFRK